SICSYNWAMVSSGTSCTSRSGSDSGGGGSPNKTSDCVREVPPPNGSPTASGNVPTWTSGPVPKGSPTGSDVGRGCGWWIRPPSRGSLASGASSMSFSGWIVPIDGPGASNNGRSAANSWGGTNGADSSDRAGVSSTFSG